MKNVNIIFKIGNYINSLVLCQIAKQIRLVTIDELFDRGVDTYQREIERKIEIGFGGILK